MEKENILFELIENIKDDKFIKIVFSDKKDGNFNMRRDSISMNPFGSDSFFNV